jgi:hypothetical protein
MAVGYLAEAVPAFVRESFLHMTSHFEVGYLEI